MFEWFGVNISKSESFKNLIGQKYVCESSTLDWTTPMREVTVKSMKVGDFIMTRTRRTFTPEFKLQMVRLFENGKSKAEIVREYDLTASALEMG